MTDAGGLTVDTAQKTLFELLPFRTVSQMDPEHWRALYAAERRNVALGELQENQHPSPRRGDIIHHMSSISESREWSRPTFYSAVALFDLYAKSASVANIDIENTAAACLYYSAAICEVSSKDNIPSLAQFVLSFRSASLQRTLEIEAHIVDTTQASCLFRKTPLDFLLLYVAEMGLDETLGQPLLSLLLQTDSLGELFTVVLIAADVAALSGLCLDFAGSTVVASAIAHYCSSCLNNFSLDSRQLLRLLEKHVFHTNALMDLELAVTHLSQLISATIREVRENQEFVEAVSQSPWDHIHLPPKFSKALVLSSSDSSPRRSRASLTSRARGGLRHIMRRLMRNLSF